LLPAQPLSIFVKPERVIPFVFVPFAILAQFLEDGKADGSGNLLKADFCERVPVVLAEGSGDGLFAVKGELAQGGVVL
jgi:hypothetical protein